MSRKARARLLYPSISTSERVNGLGVKGALLFTWLLAHCDDQGRYAGSVRKVKIEVVPMMKAITQGDVSRALDQMEEAGLIERYWEEGYGELIQILGWWEFQSGLRFKNRSRYPPPEGWRDRVSELPPRGTGGRFAKEEAIVRGQLKEGIIKLLVEEEAMLSIADIAAGLNQLPSEVKKAVEELWREGRVEVSTFTGEPPRPPFESDYHVSLKEWSE